MQSTNPNAPNSKWKGEADEVRVGVPFLAVALSAELGTPGGTAGFRSCKPNHPGLTSAILRLHGVCLLGSSQELTLRPWVWGDKVWSMKMSEAPSPAALPLAPRIQPECYPDTNTSSHSQGLRQQSPARVQQ